MSIEYLKKNVPNIPKLNEVDEIDDPMIIAHYTCEYLSFYHSEPTEIEYWIIAGEDIELPTTDGEIFHDFRCFGIAEIFEKELGFFDLLCDVRRYGGMLDKDWKPIPLSEFKWD